MNRFAIIVSLIAIAISILGMCARMANACDLALILASDVSASMVRPQKDIVRQGTATALRHPEVVHALTNGTTQVMALEFATGVGIVSNWRSAATVDDLADIAAAVEIGAPPLRLGGGTDFGALLRAARAAFDQVQCDRMVLDIATDGDPHSVVPESSAFLVEGVHTVNVIFVAGTEGDLAEMRQRTRFGWGGFLLPIADFSEFPEAMRRKLLMEVM